MVAGNGSGAAGRLLNGYEDLPLLEIVPFTGRGLSIAGSSQVAKSEPSTVRSTKAVGIVRLVM